MEQNTQLELSLRELLGEFKGVVGRLLGPCSLDDAFNLAQDANFATIGLTELVYKNGSNGGVSHEEVRTYKGLVVSCLMKFQELIDNPELNGQRWYVDLCREQMQGRLELLNEMECYQAAG